VGINDVVTPLVAQPGDRSLHRLGAARLSAPQARLALKVDRGFHHACANLDPARRFVVYAAAAERFSLDESIEVTSLSGLARELTAQ
jgi:hypothetical protein